MTDPVTAITHHPSRMESALVGVTIWLLWALVAPIGFTVLILLLSPFVLLPLGICLVDRPETGPSSPTLRRLAPIAPFLALMALQSFANDPDSNSALLSLPWLAFTTTLATIGLGRLLSRKTLLDPGIGTDAGLIFVAVGGLWLTIASAGLNPLGFSDDIVLLTAVHFHFAGFALPIAAGFAASKLQKSPLVPIAVIVTIPLTAIGITVGGTLELVAASTMALAGIATAVLLLQLGARQHGIARWLIIFAGLTLITGMMLALGWAWSTWLAWDFLALQSMAILHGSLNAVGFGLIGLIGLNLVPASQPSKEQSTSLHLRRPNTRKLENLATLANKQQTTNPNRLLKRSTPAGFRRKTWQSEVEHGDFDAAREAIMAWHGHRAAGIVLLPANPKIEVGQTLALVIPAGPISISATCRIVEVVDEPDQYGFTYATLPHHPEDGEESFIVTRHANGHIDVTVTAVWRPATIANHICPPLTQYLQNQAITRYLDGIATAPHQPLQQLATR